MKLLLLVNKEPLVRMSNFQKLFLKMKSILQIRLRLVKYFLFISLLIVFLVLMRDVWNKFSSKMTSTGITFVEPDESGMLFPPFTVCPWPVYKRRGFYFSESDYLKNTYELEDIFNNYSMPDLSNESLYSWKETRSLFYGRCYTISKKVAKLFEEFREIPNLSLNGYNLLSTFIHVREPEPIFFSLRSQ